MVVTCPKCGAKNRLGTPPPGQVPVCGACKTPLPWVVAAEHAGRLKVVKVNVDEHPGLAARYGVRSVPTLVLFRRGAPVATWVGASPKRVLEERLRPYLEGR